MSTNERNRDAQRRHRERNGSPPRAFTNPKGYGAGPPHGTRSRYGGQGVHPPCRCEPCTEANTAYQRRYNERKRNQASDAAAGYDPTYGGLLPD